MTTLLYRWLDRRGRIPRWAYWIYKDAHWCEGQDHALVLDLAHCACERRAGTTDHDYTNSRKPF
jgi:hypothetical protein